MTMPTKLKVLLGMFVVSGLFSAISGQWPLVAYAVVVCIGVARGHEGARHLLRMSGAAGVFLHFGTGVLAILATLAGGLPITALLASLVVSAIGGSSAGFSYWCLGEADVQHWMYEKSMGEIA